MAHNARVRADLTAWTAAIPLEPSELDALDEGQFAAINGDDGGSWAPADPIIIGGAGLEFTGAVPVGEDLTVGGDITISSGGTITVESGGDVNVDSGGDVTVSGHLHIASGGHLIVDSGGHVDAMTGSSHTYSTGSTVLHSSGATDTYSSGSTLTLSGTVNVDATAVVTEAENATVAEGATYTQTGPRYLSGDGRIHQRIIAGPNSDASFDGRSGDVVMITSSGLSDDRTYSLLISGCHGTRIRFVNYDALHAVLFASAAAIYMPTDYNPGSTGLRNASGYAMAVEFMYSDGSAGAPTAGWYVIGHQMVP